jgi:Fructose-bisphosphate aldolase class-I
VAQAVWAEVFKYLADQKVMLEGILLKPSMVTPGAESSKRASPDEVADYTLKLLRRRVPPAVPGASDSKACRVGGLFPHAGLATAAGMRSTSSQVRWPSSPSMHAD